MHLGYEMSEFLSLSSNTPPMGLFSHALFVVVITWKCHWNFPFFKSWYLKVAKKYDIPVEFNHVQFHVKIPPLHGPPSRHVAVVTGKWVVVSDVLCQISFRMEWQPFTLLPYMVRQRLYRSFSLGPLILPRSSVRWGTSNCYSSLCDEPEKWRSWSLCMINCLMIFQVGKTFCAFFM